MIGFVIKSFSPMLRNTLLGFATVQAPSEIIFHDVAIHRQGQSVWASPASKPMLGRDGTQLKDAGGKARWLPIVSLKDKSTRDRWSNAVVLALKEQRPEAFS
jgi:hypothetical protein